MSLFFSLFSSVNSVFCISLGLFTLSRNPGHPANIGFLLGMLGLSIVEAGNAMTMYYFNSAISPFGAGVRLSAVGQALLPLLWLPFSLTFARAEYKEVLKQWRYVLGGFLIVTLTLTGLIVTSDTDLAYSVASFSKEGELLFNRAEIQLPAASNYLYLFLIAGLVLNLVQLESTFRSSATSRRWQIKYTVFGVSAIFAFFIYLSSRGILFLKISFQMFPALSIVIFISTVMICVFIVRHRLLDVDIFVSRYVVYNSVTVLVVSIYLIVVGVIAQLIKYYKPALHEFFSTAFVFISLLIFVALGFTEALRRKIQLFINRNFYKHKYEFRDKWMESIEKISSVKSSTETCRMLLDMIARTVPSDGLSLWLYDQPLNNYQNIKLEEESKKGIISAAHPLIARIKDTGYPFNIQENGAEKKCLDLNSDFAADNKAVLCAPLIAYNEIVGFLLLGKDISGCSYVNDDFEILNAIATQTAVQLKNIRLAQDLAAAREVEAFHRLSSFIIHDLKNLTNSLSLISQNARHCMDNPEFQKDAMTTIDYTVSRMKGLINKFSSLPKGVEIKKKRVDLNGLIKKILKTMDFQEVKNITFAHHAGPAAPVSLDPDAMEMVFTNIISNAFDSISSAGEINITSRESAGFVNIFFSDTGAGMSEEFIRKKLFQPFTTTKKGGFGIGLFQSKTIVEAHGGTIVVESRQGKGSVFTVTLPV